LAAAPACILPLSSKSRGQTVFGTRHRAALGISEEIRRVTVVVSEERGAVSVAIGGRLNHESG
jgi:DNA integrity scanning protein DisA with diadenylate cyclase activity